MNQESPKFLCDAMLAHLGRLLRMAGYDTLIATGSESDHELVLRCLSEERYLLTSDSQMQQRKAASKILIYLPGNLKKKWASHLTKTLSVNWLHAPFTICLECNSPLISPPPEKRFSIPKNILEQDLPIKYCSACDKVFWEGSHVTHMRESLHALQRQAS